MYTYCAGKRIEIRVKLRLKLFIDLYIREFPIKLKSLHKEQKLDFYLFILLRLYVRKQDSLTSLL